ncbi:MAG: response regulator transcription factor [Proteobacteria bacterium]|nr:response regulator transcription factor [Pseudomonadota bacterium]
MQPSQRVLIIDDDIKLQRLLKDYLEGYGYRVATRPDGLEAMDAVLRETPDIIILDIMMPGKDGLEVLRDIRRQASVPVIMLTAKGEDADRIVGLELGADDYLPKPFNPRELVARIKAVTRRAGGFGKGAGKAVTTISAGGLALDTSRKTLVAGDDEIELSGTEFRLLEMMMNRPDTIFSRDELLNYARGRDVEAFDRSIDVHVSNLRAKLKPYPEHRERIKTVWGSGYMFVDRK